MIAGKFKAHRKGTRSRQVQITDCFFVVREREREGCSTVHAPPLQLYREITDWLQSKRLGGAKARLLFDSEEEKSPMKKEEGHKETDL